MRLALFLLGALDAPTSIEIHPLALSLPWLLLTPLFIGAYLFSFLLQKFPKNTWDFDITFSSCSYLSLIVLSFDFGYNFLVTILFYLLYLVICPLPGLYVHTIGH